MKVEALSLVGNITLNKVQSYLYSIWSAAET